MPVTITIRNVPEEVGNELAARAAAKGSSLQEFIRNELIELCRRPARRALVDRIDRRLDGTNLTSEQLAGISDSERR